MLLQPSDRATYTQVTEYGGKSVFDLAPAKFRNASSKSWVWPRTLFVTLFHYQCPSQVSHNLPIWMVSIGGWSSNLLHFIPSFSFLPTFTRSNSSICTFHFYFTFSLFLFFSLHPTLRTINKSTIQMKLYEQNFFKTRLFVSKTGWPPLSRSQSAGKPRNFCFNKIVRYTSSNFKNKFCCTFWPNKLYLSFAINSLFN